MSLNLFPSENRDEFIAGNKAFIYSIASNICKRKLSWENDDELSIAMIAFNNACNTYREGKGNFHGYAKALIKNALIDFFRKSKNNPYLAFGDEDEDLEYIEYKTSIEQFHMQDEKKARAEEIVLLSKELSQYSLTFSDLANSSPSHKDTRDALLNLAFKCVKEDTILEYIKSKKMLPIKEIMLLAGVNRKLLEKWRRYILTLIIVLSSDEFTYIKSYLNIGVGEKNGS
jgi:RNA polymerase sigma factor